MTRAEYLYGVTPNKYKKIQEQLCNTKIRDAKNLLRQLRQGLITQDVIRRAEAINKAIDWNNDLLNELEN